jgi:hypothetical protein
MEAKYSSETSVDLKRTTWSYFLKAITPFRKLIIHCQKKRWNNKYNHQISRTKLTSEIAVEK